MTEQRTSGWNATAPRSNSALRKAWSKRALCAISKRPDSRCANSAAMSRKKGALARSSVPEPSGNVHSRREDVLSRVVQRSTRSPSTVTTPISAMRSSPGLSPVVSTSTNASGLDLPTAACIPVMRQEALSNERSTMSSPGHGYFRIEESAHCGQALLLDDLPRFQQEAALALDVQPHWMDVSVAGPNGEPLMSARAPLPSALPADDLAGVEQVAHS